MATTLDLQGAAKILHLHPETVKEMARAGRIPAAKVGRAWVFIQEDLIESIRKGYSKWQSTSATELRSPSLLGYIYGTEGVKPSVTT